MSKVVPIPTKTRKYSQLLKTTKMKYQIISLCFLCFVTFARSRGMVYPGSVSNCLNKKESLVVQTGSKEADKIDRLPGQEVDAGFDQYGGYVTVDGIAGRALYYYFSEACNDKSRKPLVLWLSGGPGCSSLGYGAFEQTGPFKVNKDGKTLRKNEFAWNKEANILYLESPAGTGFSYSNTTSDYALSGDHKTAEDAYIFLMNWLEKFPEYKSRDFFIAGESYAGHFVPQLAKVIVDNNICGHQAKINLRGIAIGNGLIDSETYGWGRVEYLWSHALISDETRSEIKQNCNFSSRAAISEKCNNLINAALNTTGNINPDEIYAPLCNPSSPGLIHDDTSYDPCTDNYVTAYLNTPQIQAALHANFTKIPNPWELCSAKIQGLWNDTAITTLPEIQELMRKGIPVWLYSGDVDSLIPVTSTRFAIKKLNVPVTAPWRAWYYGGEVGGYVTKYDKLTFATVRGAGHEVPSYQPGRALSVFRSFILGQLPPSS